MTDSHTNALHLIRKDLLELTLVSLFYGQDHAMIYLHLPAGDTDTYLIGIYLVLWVQSTYLLM